MTADLRVELQDLVLDAVRVHGGRASVLAVAKRIWEHHSTQKLRDRAAMKLCEQRSWELNQ